MKLLRKLFFPLCVLTLLLSFSFTSSASAEETKFYVQGKGHLVTYNDRQLDVTNGKEKLKFIFVDNQLILTSRNEKKYYLKFNSTDGEYPVEGFYIRKIITTSPQMTFFEINTYRGTHAKNCGYWIVGKQNDKWVKFVTLDSLATMGYTPNKWHMIKTYINENKNGHFILTSIHEYMPPGAQYQSQRKYAQDLKLELFWDQNAQWFGMRAI